MSNRAFFVFYAQPEIHCILIFCDIITLFFVAIFLTSLELNEGINFLTFIP